MARSAQRCERSEEQSEEHGGVRPTAHQPLRRLVTHPRRGIRCSGALRLARGSRRTCHSSQSELGRQPLRGRTCCPSKEALAGRQHCAAAAKEESQKAKGVILSHRCRQLTCCQVEQQRGRTVSEQFPPIRSCVCGRGGAGTARQQTQWWRGAAAVLLALEPRASTMSHLPVDAVHPAAPCEPAVACVVASEPGAPQMENPLSLALESAHDRCAPERSDGAAVCLRPGSLVA